MGFVNKYRSIQNPNYESDNPTPKLLWANHTDWAYKSCQLDGRISIKDAYATDGGKYFIRMTTDEAKEIINAHVANHTVQLGLNTNRNCLCIKIDNEGDWINFPSLHEDKDPFKILAFAFKHPNRKITREMLHESKIADVRNKYLKTQVFSDNSTVKALSQSSLLDLDKNFILVRKNVTITADELDELKASLNI